MGSSWYSYGGAVVAASILWLVFQWLSRPVSSSPNAIPLFHPTSALTIRWFDSQAKRHGELKTLYAAHAKHGPIVRLGPHEISIVSEEGLRKIYVAGLDKDAWYQQTFPNYGVQNLVCTLDHATHSKIRRMIAPLYSKSHLQRASDMKQITEDIVQRKLLPMLGSDAWREEGVNVVALLEWTVVDFVTAYLFGPGRGLNFMSDKNGRDQYFAEWDKLRENGDLMEKPYTEQLLMRVCKNAVHSAGPVDPERCVASKTYAELLYSASKWSLAEDDVIKRCASEMLDHVIASQETLTITLTYILYRLSRRPDVQDMLRAELGLVRPTYRRADSATECMPTPGELDSLPVLDAVIQETLRLHAANPARMRRVAPPEGLTLHGHYLPHGTTVSSNAYCLHRNPDVFPNPLVWEPERWLPRKPHASGGDEHRRTMRRWFFAFGSGPRVCIAQHFAVQVMKCIIAAIYAEYRSSIIDDEGIEQSDSYNSGPVSHSLILQFQAVEG